MHKLQKENRIDDLQNEGKSSFDNLASYDNKLVNIDSEKEVLVSQHNIDKAEENAAQALAENLDAGGGTMQKVTIENTSSFIDKKLREMQLLKEALIVNVMRGEEMIIPDGNTVLHAEDEVTLLGKKEDVETAVKILSA